MKLLVLLGVFLALVSAVDVGHTSQLHRVRTSATATLNVLVITYNDELLKKFDAGATASLLPAFDGTNFAEGKKPDIIAVCQQETKNSEMASTIVNFLATKNIKYNLAASEYKTAYTKGFNRHALSVITAEGLTVDDDLELTGYSHSLLGKGGVYGSGTFTKGGVAFKIAFVDVHLPTEGDKKHVIVNKMLHKLASSKNYDKKKYVVADLSEFDTVLIAGDFNNRLSGQAPKVGETATKLAGADYSTLFALDTLSSYKLITEDRFTCSSPLSCTPHCSPTYKRSYEPDNDVYPCTAWAAGKTKESAMACYFAGKSADDNVEAGHGAFQLGWLDRVCYKAKDGVTTTFVSGGQVTADSFVFADHAPVSVLVSVSKTV